MKKIFILLIISFLSKNILAQNNSECFRDCQFYYVTITEQADGPKDRQNFLKFLQAKKQELAFYSLISKYRGEKLSEALADSVLMTEPVHIGGEAISADWQFIDKLPENAVNLGLLNPEMTATFFLLNSGGFMEIKRSDCRFSDLILVVKEGEIVGFAAYCLDNKFAEVKLPCSPETVPIRESAFYRLTELMYEATENYIRKFED